MFVRILNTSLISCYIIVVVMLFRALLIRAERKYVYWLWFVVFVNLCIPFRISGPFSLIPRWVANLDITEWDNTVYLPEETIVEEVTSTITHNYASADGNGVVSGTDSNSESTYIQKEAGAYSEYIPNMKITENETGSGHEDIAERFAGAVPGTDSNIDITYHAYHKDKASDGCLQKILAVVWGAGVCVLAAGAIRSSVKLQRRLKDAEPFDGDAISAEVNTRIKTADGLETPFLWGIFEPVIYLPRRIDENERKYIVAHENFHRKRRDYIVKPLFFIITVIHWFNPFVWAAYFLFVRDMEISCDEAVIAAADKDIRKEYAARILKSAARLKGYTLT
ncbi:MAG: M56 family metallopeptidase, partial [Lachnospiraceae bacterium]|nr:M56 family metallopeptidase [Lachnospiraceae bacterium]